MAGSKKEFDVDECFEEYKREFRLKSHVGTVIDMVNQNMHTKETAFDSIKRKFEELGFK